MLASVVSVDKQTEEQFRAHIPKIKALAEGKDYLLKARFDEGKTPAGHPYFSSTVTEKGSKDSQYYYVAIATVYLADKGKTISLVFEGQGKMRSKTFQSFENDAFDEAAKSICLSPK